MNPNSDLKNNESVMAVNAESSTIKAATAESSTVGAGYAESRISEYAARFAAYSDERLKQSIDHERKVRGWAASAATSSPPCEESVRNEALITVRGYRCSSTRAENDADF